MNKPSLNYAVEVALALSFIVAFVTGIVKLPGFFGSLGISERGWPLALISNVHDWSGIAFVVLGLVHIALHWDWITCMTRSLLGKTGKKCDNS